MRSNKKRLWMRKKELMIDNIYFIPSLTIDTFANER
jgi:hypothetical protein